MTPYTTRTGVQIGLTYTKPAPGTDKDAERIQRALLGDCRSVDWDGIVIVVACIAVVAVGVWL